MTFSHPGPYDVFDGCGLTVAARGAVKAEDNRLKNRYQIPTRRDVDGYVNLDTMLSAVGPRVLDIRMAAHLFGYVKDITDGGVESCNCYAQNPIDRDTHIQLVYRLGQGAKDVVVIEVTPRTRAMAAKQGLDWSTEGLRQQFLGKRVEVEGWLYYDPDHTDQAFTTDPDDSNGRKNWRGTNWEIHPVTSIVLAE